MYNMQRIIILYHKIVGTIPGIKETINVTCYDLAHNLLYSFSLLENSGICFSPVLGALFPLSMIYISHTHRFFLCFKIKVFELKILDALNTVVSPFLFHFFSS